MAAAQRVHTMLTAMTAAAQLLHGVCALFGQVAVHRSDTLSALVQLDKDLRITKADDVAGLIFGLDAKHLLHRHFAR